MTKKLILCLTLGTVVKDAHVHSEPRSTLTPSASAPSGAVSDNRNKFGIRAIALTSPSYINASQSQDATKRDGVARIGDG